MKDIGNKPVMAANIKYYMKERGINAKDLSRAIDVPYTTVLSWIKADYYPRIDKIEKMSEFFGCLKSDLIEDKKKKPAADKGNELSESQRELMRFAEGLSEEEAAQVLQTMKLLVQGLRK